jgi:hypothetical protein
MIGKTVWAKFGNNGFRCGTVIEERMEDKWKFVRVDWIEDHGFEMDRQRLINLRGEDFRSDWSRADKVHVFDKQEFLNKINKL